jgi:hypothetical protein
MAYDVKYTSFFEYILEVLYACSQNIHGVTFAVIFLPFLALWAGWTRRPLTCSWQEYLSDPETWNFGLIWTQAGLISVSVTAQDAIARVKFADEHPDYYQIVGKNVEGSLIVNSHVPHLFVVLCAFLAILGLVLVQIRTLMSLRRSRRKWQEAKNAARTDPQAARPTNWIEYLRDEPLPALSYRIGLIVLAGAVGLISAYAAYRLD